MYAHRKISQITRQLAEQYPVITITGPRQSGKTTLAKHLFPDKKYVNLEHIETREFALNDPVGFLEELDDNAIIDEVQRVPSLLSYIQVLADEKRKNNLFILTGSQHFSLMASVSQSLAGRTALLQLFPFSISETFFFGETKDWAEFLLRGFFPRIYDQKLNPSQALADYLSTYVERDIRQLSQIQNLGLFQKFITLCAGRIGQVLNLASLANAVGVSQPTIREWLSLLQTSYIVFLLPPFYKNIKKRLVRSPKLYFYDVGLASRLLGITSITHVKTHPLTGNLFENLIIADILKTKYNSNLHHNLSFYRDSNGTEIDLLIHIAQHVLPIEIKSAKTIHSDFFNAFKRFEKIEQELPYGKMLIYGGREAQKRQSVQIANIWNLENVFEMLK